MCFIDKVATKQWRQVWTFVSKTTKQVHTKAWDQVYLEANSREKLFALMPPAEETFRVVFLRDPLERFLSAFLDKCVGVNNRREGYCWPKRVYYNENDSDENDYTTRGLTPQQQFAQFVNVMPLQWNIHFAPMGLSETMRALNFTFHLGPRSSRKRTETSAVNKVEEFYTPAILRKVLQYTAIDYMTLNLSIPEWAERMLQDEEEENKSLSRRARNRPPLFTIASNR
jgi:hypothetical protein